MSWRHRLPIFLASVVYTLAGLGILAGAVFIYLMLRSGNLQ